MIRNMGEFAEYLDEVRDLPVDVDRWQVEKLALAGVQNELYFYLPGVAKEELGRLGARAFNNLKKLLQPSCTACPAGRA